MTRTCKNCHAKFEPRMPLQVVCGLECAKAIAPVLRARLEKRKAATERKADKIKRQAQKSLGKLTAEAQTAFNFWVRTRDQLAGHACISSGRPLDWTGNAVDAGHYRSRGSAPHLRFDERNCHAQSKQENRYASGNATGYRLGLISRIGLEAVEALEADQEPRRYRREDLERIRAEYTAKAHVLKKELAA